MEIFLKAAFAGVLIAFGALLAQKRLMAGLFYIACKGIIR